MRPNNLDELDTLSASAADDPVEITDIYIA